jgi:hypothetical protein
MTPAGLESAIPVTQMPKTPHCRPRGHYNRAVLLYYKIKFKSNINKKNDRISLAKNNFLTIITITFIPKGSLSRIFIFHIVNIQLIRDIKVVIKDCNLQEADNPQRERHIPEELNPQTPHGKFIFGSSNCTIDLSKFPLHLQQIAH